MTALTVVVAQTRVGFGFLTGGRQKSFRALPQEKQTVQLEEAYARATGNYQSQVFVPHHGTPRHERVDWCCHGNGSFHVRGGTCLGWTRLTGPSFPPPAIAEVLQDYVTNHHKVPRLHLIVEPLRPCGPAPPLRCRCYASGYALDNSEFPFCLVWPQRDGHCYSLLDTATNDVLELRESYSFQPLGLQRFYPQICLH